jgi:hypothetical protein
VLIHSCRVGLRGFAVPTRRQLTRLSAHCFFMLCMGAYVTSVDLLELIVQRDPRRGFDRLTLVPVLHLVEIRFCLEAGDSSSVDRTDLAFLAC